MGWLECEPEPLFQPTVFRVGDVEEVVPRQIILLVKSLATHLPQWLLQQFLKPIVEFTFAARPMQVRQSFPFLQMSLSFLAAGLCQMAFQNCRQAG